MNKYEQILWLDIFYNLLEPAPGRTRENVSIAFAMVFSMPRQAAIQGSCGANANVGTQPWAALCLQSVREALGVYVATVVLKVSKPKHTRWILHPSFFF